MTQHEEIRCSKAEYIDNIEKGSLVAFRLYPKDAKNFSGKITKIGKTHVEIETKNGKRFFVDKNNITWVNTNGRWPKHIILALRGIEEEVVEGDKDEETITEQCGDGQPGK